MEKAQRLEEARERLKEKKREINRISKMMHDLFNQQEIERLQQCFLHGQPLSVSAQLDLLVPLESVAIPIEGFNKL
jgi:hypothetical protein